MRRLKHYMEEPPQSIYSMMKTAGSLLIWQHFEDGWRTLWKIADRLEKEAEGILSDEEKEADDDYWAYQGHYVPTEESLSGSYKG